MSIRFVAVSAALFSLLCAAPALAAEGNPIQGVGVSVESSPGGIIMKSADCTPPKGTLTQLPSGKWVCKLTPARPATATSSNGH